RAPEPRGQRLGPRVQEPARPSLTHGPILGRVQTDCATVWLRTSQAAMVSVDVSPRPDFAFFRSSSAWTEADRDFTAKLLLTRLTPGTDFYFRVALDGMLTPGIHRFRTAPSASTELVKLAVLSDFNCNRPAPVFRAVSQEDPDVLVFLGDLDHRDPKTLL